jgi:large subunit ribosomal protein L2
MYAFASVGRVLFKENRNFLNSKAGYWRGFGFKPTVRGVAMNPVDHPHGGRTNSIKYPRTPWGKTTKYK